MRQVLKIHKRDRQVVDSYPTVTLAAEAAGMRRRRMEDLCMKRNLPAGSTYYRYADDFDPDESFEGKRNCPVELVDTITGDSLWFADQAGCATAACWSPTRVSSCICSGSSSLLGDRYAARYAPTRQRAIERTEKEK